MNTLAGTTGSGTRERIVTVAFALVLLNPLRPDPLLAQESAEQEPAAVQPGANGQTPAEADDSSTDADSTEGGSTKAGASESDAAEKKAIELPKLNEMEIPTLEQIYRDPPVDWVVVQSAEFVLVVEPVFPRPDTLVKMQQQIDESRNWPPPKDADELAEQREKRNRLRKLEVIFADDEQRTPFQIDMKEIRQIIHHEDLILGRADLLLDEGKTDDAFGLIYRLDRRVPDWPGLADRKNRLVFIDARTKLKNQDVEQALILLEELHRRDPQFPGLSGLLGEVADRLISAAVEEEDFHRARHFLRRLTSKESEHPIAAKWTDALLGRAVALRRSAEEASEQGRHDAAAELIDGAARVWPRTRGLRNLHSKLTHRFQSLNVGVLSVPSDASAGFPPTRAERRTTRLTRINLFDVDHIDDAPHYRTDYFEQWEPTDLGRQADFTLKPNRAYWESRPPATAADVVSTLAERLDPASDRYDERLASYIHSLRVQSPYEFQVRFSRVPLRIEALFRFPITGSPSSADVSGDTAPIDTALGEGTEDRDDILSRRFYVHARDADRITFRRVIPEPDGLSEYHLAEVNEILYPTYDHATQALFRGQVSCLPHVRARDVDRFITDDRFFVVPYAVPTTHVLQFNPASKPLQNRELRRALAYAVDRRRLLEEIVLGGTNAASGRIITGPYANNSYAYNTLVPEREYDLFKAFALSAAARKMLENDVPRLKLIAVGDSVVDEIVEDLIAQWEKIGIQVESVTGDGLAAGSPTDWDIVYRKVQMEEPLTELWPFLTLEPVARVESLRYFPNWLRQELIALDNAGDWNSALSMLKRLHQHLWAEVAFIPLWEVDDVLVMRKNVRQFPSRPMHPYQGTQRWIVGSFYPTEEP